MDPQFHPEAFALLRGIRAEPTVHFYHDHRADFKAFVESPLQSLMRRAAERLPEMARSRLETRRNVFSRFAKNDFGRGLAWTNYWGAFYPKGSRRIMDAQLAVWMNAERLGVSFYINDYGRVPRERFSRSCARYQEELLALLVGLTETSEIQLPLEGRTRVDEAGRTVAEQPMTWADWLARPQSADFWAFVAFTPDEVTTMPASELEDWVVRLFGRFFPLALLAMEEDALPLIRVYTELYG